MSTFTMKDSSLADVAVTGELEARHCALIGDIHLTPQSHLILNSCYSETPGQQYPSISMAEGAMLQGRNYAGGLRIILSEGNLVSIDLDPGHLYIDESCTNLEVVVRGIGKVTDHGQNTKLNRVGLSK
jgi:hypothetical protein